MIMTNTYTPNLNLAKPANGDVNWHIPINENFDIIDEKIGPLYNDITSLTTNLKLNKNVDMNNKNINNVDIISINKIKSLSYFCIPDRTMTKVRYSDTAHVEQLTANWITVKTTPPASSNMNGGVTVYYNTYSYSSNFFSFARLLKNDIEIVGSGISSTNSSKYGIIDIDVKTGDVIKLQIKGDNQNNYCMNTLFNIYAVLLPLIDENETW